MKIAFMHIMRNMGLIIKYKFAEKKEYLSINAPCMNCLQVAKNLDSEQLKELSKLNCENLFVHSSVNFWNEDIIKKFRENNFYCFTILRHPGEQLCSLYFYESEQGMINPLNVTLNDYIFSQLTEGDNHRIKKELWQIPSFVGQLNFAKEYNKENLDKLFSDLKTEFPKDMVNHKLNRTINQSYVFYVRNNMILPETVAMLEASENFKKYKQLSSQ